MELQGSTVTPPTAPRSKTGCLSCRRRKKKCDELRPVCTGCTNNFLTCEWPPSNPQPQRRRRKRDALSFPPSQTSVEIISTKPDLSPWAKVGTLPSETQNQKLVHHFVHTTSQMLSVQRDPEKMHFMDHLVPTAVNSPLIMKCVLGVSAVHLARCEGNVGSLNTVAYVHYGSAIRTLRGLLTAEAMPENTEKQDETLLAILLLLFYENLGFEDGARALPHINAATALVEKMVLDSSEKRNSDMRGFLFELFIYFSTLTHFGWTNNSSLSTLLPKLFQTPALTKHKSYGMLFGNFQELFSIITRISDIQRDIKEAGRTAEITSELRTMEQTLMSWQPEPSISQELRVTDDISRASELYRLTCLLSVVKIIDPTLTPNSIVIRETVASFVAHLEKIPPKAPVNTILTWPLVIMGCDAVIATHRRIISARLHCSSESIKSANIERSLKFLRHTWKMQPDLGVPAVEGSLMSFKDLMQSSQMSVILV